MRRTTARSVARLALAGVAGVAALAAIPAPGAAQLPEAEDAFGRGDYRTARALYDSVLARDSLNPRALYRLAIFDSWDGKLKLSLARFVRLRLVEPRDPETMVAHARVLSWDGQTRWSEALYDSVLALAPDRVDALAGRARAVAWSGDLNRAERLWRDALERHPDDPEILTGLAQTLYWEGQPALAEGYVTRARELAPTDRATRDLFDQVRAERRPILSVLADGANDIEHNRFVALSATFGASLRYDMRGSLRASLRRNDAGSLTGRSDGVDGWLVKSFPAGATVRGGVGMRVLNPDSGATRRFATAQLSAGLRPAKFASVDIAYSRYPFDETVLLVRRRFVWDELGVSGDYAPRPNLTLSAVANAAWLSDGNRRLIGVAAVMVGVAKGLDVGGYARVMGYREANPGRGYFAPDRFILGEGRIAYAWRRHPWGMRATGGLGAQQIGTGSATQAEWHGDVTVSRTWRAINELSLVGLYTNSAAARSGTATTGRYWYWSVGLRYRRGL
ncbi:MAG: tetratricopeptide repeat protein [Gemmatimonadales bacterium]